jgi:putative transcriptional regulator
MIEFRLDEVLANCRRSAYWLSKETGIAQSVLSKIRQGKTGGIQWDTLERICKALQCRPGDLIVMLDEKSAGKKRAKSRG